MNNSEKHLLKCLKVVAAKYAAKYGYELFNENETAMLFVDRSERMIEIRERFGNRRLDIYGPNRSWFVSVEYTSYQTYKESQVFGEKGIWKLIEIKKAVDKELAKGLQ